MVGAIALPETDGQFPAALLIAGSGQVDRNENCRKISINATREIAHYLADHNVVSLRYDKRGVGTSDGNYWETGFYDNVYDAEAAIEFLKCHPKVKKNAVFIIGHSGGALIATILATNRTDIAGITLLAGTAQIGESVLKWQAKQVLDGLRGINKFLINLLRIDVAKAQQKQIDKIKNSSRLWYRVKYITKLNAKWFREFMAYNPAEDYSKIRVPILAITGSKDIQVDPKDLLKMKSLIQSKFESHEIPNLSHLLRLEEESPSITNYKKQVKQPVDPRVLQLIAQWLSRNTDNDETVIG